MVCRLLTSLAQKSAFFPSAEPCGCSLLPRAAVGAGFVLALKTQGQSLFQAQDDACLRCALLLCHESLLCCTVVKTCSELLSCSSRSLVPSCGFTPCSATLPALWRAGCLGWAVWGTSLSESSWTPLSRGQSSGRSLPCSGGETYRALWLISFQLLEVVCSDSNLRLVRKFVSQIWDRFFFSEGQITSGTAGCHFLMFPTVYSSKKRCEGAEIFRILEIWYWKEWKLRERVRARIYGHQIKDNKGRCC